MARTTPGTPAEVDLILDRTGATAYPPRVPGAAEPPQYMYREGSLMVRQQDVGRVWQVLRDLDVTPGEDHPTRALYPNYPTEPGVAPVIPGASRLFWDQRARTVPDLLAVLDQRLGVGVARPDHLFVVASHPCPATEPLIPPVPAPHPPVASGSACTGKRVVVSIVDTGLAPDADTHSWLGGVTGDNDQLIHDGVVEHFGGHGTFVAGTVRAIAPHATVFVEGSLTITANDPSLSSTGAGFESDLSAQLLDALNHDPDVMVLTFATETREQLSPLGFDAAFESRLQQVKGLAFLAPAGNEGSSARQYPAACPWVIGVGALSANWNTRADFSSHGPWVDVYAPGEGLVNAFTSGSYQYLDPPTRTATFTGLAEWSGTSFSTPLVAGMITARMSATEESGRQAADSLLGLAQAQRISGVGPVLYPDQACCEVPCRCAARSDDHRPCGAYMCGHGERRGLQR